MLAGTHHWPAQERVTYGRPAAEAVAEEVARAGAQRVFVTTTRSLTNGALVARIVQGLGARFAGKFDAIGAHSPREGVIGGAQAMRAAGADFVVAVGGGSVIDATKVMLLALWRGAQDVDALSKLAGVRGKAAEASAWGADPQALRMIAVPTTLSAAEFFPNAGVTDVQRRVKQSYSHPLAVPRAVILDPAATLETPLDLMLSTGMRAVDHAVEGWCSVKSTPMSDAANREAMRLLALSLKGMFKEKDNLEFRSLAQHGMWLSRIGSMAGVPMGASHGIGYLLGGGYGVPHGITSCITLHAVLAWNAPATGARQADVAGYFGEMREFVSSLGLPTRLRDVGMSQDELPRIAASWDGAAPIATNPRKVHSKEELLEILELAF